MKHVNIIDINLSTPYTVHYSKNFMITKAIIPVAGIGSRFLPASKSIPKEMFPLVDKPVIQYIVEEVVASGITDIIFVTSTYKRALEDYFDTHFELEYRLEKKGKISLKDEVCRLKNMANFYFIRQPEPLGDGEAIIRAARMLKNGESCAVLWGDDVIVSKEPVLKKIIDVHEKYTAPVFAVERIEGKAIEQYGVIAGEKKDECLYQVSHIIEKPKREEAPSNLGIVGRYILTPNVLTALQNPKPVEGEIRTSHALRDAIEKGPVYAYEFDGTRFDCGNKLGWLKANIVLGLKDKEIKEELGKFIKANVVTD